MKEPNEHANARDIPVRFACDRTGESGGHAEVESIVFCTRALTWRYDCGQTGGKAKSQQVCLVKQVEVVMGTVEVVSSRDHCE